MGLPPIRGVFFDLDDTLIDSGPAFDHGCRTAVSLICERHSLDHDQVMGHWWQTLGELVEALPHDGSMQKVREIRFHRLMERLGIQDDELAEEADVALGRAQLARLKAFEDVAALELLPADLLLGIITNGAADEHWDSQVTKARHAGLYDRFECFLVSDAERARKPRPDMFLTACARHSLRPEECVYVGDSPANDVAGAHSAGMRAIWLNRTGREYAFETEPWRTIRTLRELPSVLEDAAR